VNRILDPPGICNIKRAELLIAAQIAKEDFSLKKSEVFVNNSKHMFPDSLIHEQPDAFTF
jgi:uncharacterized protein YktB (UPF0637 family)